MDFERIFITGDIHGDVQDLELRSLCISATEKDLIIILGDCGFEISSFYTDGLLSPKDENRQLWVKKHIPATIFCIQGNHEVPFSEMHGLKSEIFGGKVIMNNGIIFALNGEEYTINNKSFLVIGGAYSVDKHDRIAYGYPYWENEQISETERKNILDNINNKAFDYVLTHTCPYNFRPIEMFLDNIDQSKVDDSMELFLQKVYDTIFFNKWFCGHWHTEKSMDNLRFLFHDIIELKNDR